MNQRTIAGFDGLLGTADAPPGRALTDDAIQDLGLDRVLDAAHVDAAVAAAYRTGLTDERTVRDRQAVFRDLEDEPIRVALTDLADATRRAVAERRDAERTRQAPLRRRLYLTAVLDYVAALDRAVVVLRPVSAPALADLHEHVRSLCASPALERLRTRSRSLEQRWRDIRFTLQVEGAQVAVAPADGEPDLTAEVAEALAPFATSPATVRRARPGAGLLGHSLGSVDEWILDTVARLEADFFVELGEFADEDPDFVDPALERFAVELGFFTGYRAVMATVRTAGVRFALPEVSAADRALALTDVVDLGLGLQLAAKGERPVGNAIELRAGERIVLISGPNQGGKSTIARAVGQVLHLASIGCPVPAAAARVPLADGVLTLFPRPESLDLPEGGLGSEVVRLHALLDVATARSVLILNELFASTTSADALVLLTEVVRRIRALGALAFCVTFLDAGMDGDAAVVSMVAEVDPDDPARRTFVLTRRAADGRAYAQVLAERHGLTTGAIERRILGASR